MLTTFLYELIIPLVSPSHKVRQDTIKRVEVEAACELFASLSHCRYRRLATSTYSWNPLDGILQQWQATASHKIDVQYML